MENTSKNNNENQNYHLTNTSRFVLPILFVLLTVLAICFKAVKDFKKDLNLVIVWALFVVVLLYCAVSIVDAILSRKGKMRKYLIIMASLVAISDLVFIILFYL